MTIASPSQRNTQREEALQLLADLYAHRLQAGLPAQPLALVRRHVCERLRDVLSQAHDLPSALFLLEELTKHVEKEQANKEAEVAAWREYVGEARSLVAQVIQAGGSTHVLLAGETDGFRHVCLPCCQDESVFERIRFFNQKTRRPLLKPEVSGRYRSAYARCQICLQALAPVKSVVLVPTGTKRHEQGCDCLDCNHAGFACLLTLYESDEHSHALLLPRVAQIAAPSRQQARQRALTLCRQQGWYVLFDQHASQT